jgi:transposase
MSKFDARKLTHEELTQLRKRSVAAVQDGMSPEIVAQSAMISRASIYNWLALYRGGGWSALDAGKRGGRPRKLDGKAMKWIYDTVTMKRPEQFKFPFALWTSKMLVKLIKDKLGIQLSKSSICRVLNQLGLSSQKPLWRAHQQDPEKVKKWINKEFPSISARAKRERAEVWFSDEAGIKSDAHSGKTWSKRGKTPVVRTTGARFGLNLISAVNRRGELRFMCINGRMNAGVFIEFLKRLMNGADKKVFLVVDGHPCHKAKKVKSFVEENQTQIELFFQPPYSPELNADEHVWNDLKNNCIGRKVIAGPDMMKKAVLSFLRFLQKTPSRVASYFHAPELNYTLN